METAEPYRRQRFPSAVTTGWALAVRAAGRRPLYSTTWDNAGSRGVARKLGLLIYGEDWHID